MQNTQSGVLVLLLRLAQELYLDSTEEVLVTLDLLSRLVSLNIVIIFGNPSLQLCPLVKPEPFAFSMIPITHILRHYHMHDVRLMAD